MSAVLFTYFVTWRELLILGSRLLEGESSIRRRKYRVITFRKYQVEMIVPLRTTTYLLLILILTGVPKCRIVDPELVMFCYLNGGPVAWSSKLQPSPALSTTEAEFYAMCDTAKEIRRLQMVLGELGFPQPPRPYVKAVGEPGVKNTGTIMFEDNVSSMGVGKQDGFLSKTRHIDLRLQFIQDCV